MWLITLMAPLFELIYPFLSFKFGFWKKDDVFNKVQNWEQNAEIWKKSIW